MAEGIQGVYGHQWQGNNKDAFKTANARAWVKFNLLTEEEIDFTILSRMCPGTLKKINLSLEYSCHKYSYVKEKVQIRKPACDLEKFLNLATPGLLAAEKDLELYFHFVNCLPKEVSLQL